MPGVTLLLWLAHACETWRRPTSVGPFGWLLLVGLPLALVGTVVAFAIAPPDLEPSPYEALPQDQIHDWRLRLLFLGAELLTARVAVPCWRRCSAVRSTRWGRAVPDAGRGLRRRVSRGCGHLTAGSATRLGRSGACGDVQLVVRLTRGQCPPGAHMLRHVPALVVGAAAALIAAGCAAGTSTTVATNSTTQAPATPAQPSSFTPAADLHIPVAAAGEVVGTTCTPRCPHARSDQHRQRPEAWCSYAVKGACQATTTGLTAVTCRLIDARSSSAGRSCTTAPS